MAGATWSSHKPVEAEQQYRRILQTSREVYGENDRLTIFVMLALGFHFVVDGRWSEARDLLGDALERGRLVLSEEDPVLRAIASQLGRALRRGGRYAEALEVSRYAYELGRREGVPRLTLTDMRATFGLAEALRAAGKPEEAEQLEREHVATCKRVLGNHPYTMWSIAYLGSRLNRQKMYDEAEVLLRDALDQIAPALDKDDAHTGLAQSALARALEAQDEPDQAEALFRQAVDTYYGLYPAYVRDFLFPAMSELAWFLERRGKPADAVSVLRRCVDLQRESLGHDDPDTLESMNDLAWILKDDEERLAEAEDLAREATSLARGALGEDDRRTINIADTLAVVLFLRGKYNEAIFEFEAVASAATATAGNDRWFTMMSAEHYGRCLVALDRYEDAETVLLAIHDSGDESGSQALIDLYDAWGKPAKAAQHRREVEESRASD
jgi:tetratricopeptide (TPR) repeat protein